MILYYICKGKKFKSRSFHLSTLRLKFLPAKLLDKKKYEPLKCISEFGCVYIYIIFFFQCEQNYLFLCKYKINKNHNSVNRNNTFFIYREIVVQTLNISLVHVKGEILTTMSHVTWQQNKKRVMFPAWRIQLQILSQDRKMSFLIYFTCNEFIHVYKILNIILLFFK
jgi:hypothetical protein